MFELSADIKITEPAEPTQPDGLVIEGRSLRQVAGSRWPAVAYW
jgi:hypothetical protein